MQLLVRSGPDAGQRFDLGRPVQIIGRQIGTDITVHDPQVSRRHAQLDVRGPGVVALTDLGSVNGTYINGRRIGVQPEILRPGDTLQIGDTLFAFQSDSSAPAFDPLQTDLPVFTPPPPKALTPLAATQAVPLQTATVSPPRKARSQNRAEVIVGGIALLVILGLIVAVAGYALGFIGGTDTNATAPATATPPTRGASGTNAPPPVATTIAPTTTPTTLPVATTAAAPQGTGSTAKRKTVKGVGANFSVPTDWRSQVVDNSQSALVSATPTSSVYNDVEVRVVRLAIKPAADDATARLNSVVTTIQQGQQIKSWTPQPVAPRGNGATILVDTVTTDNTALRLYLYSTQSDANIPYIVVMRANQSHFQTFATVFEDVINSLTFSTS